MDKMRNSAPGHEDVRLIQLAVGGVEVTNRVVQLVQFMFENAADTWEDELKLGLVIHLFKKGDRNKKDN